MIDIPLDFSAISQMSCRRRYQLTCVYGIDASNEYSMFGSAFHKYAEYKLKGIYNPVNIIQDVLDLATQFKVDFSALLICCTIFNQQVKLPPPLVDIFDEPMIEYKFSFPIMVIGKYRIILCGTSDYVYATDKCIFFVDWKTTLATGATLERFIDSYVTSLQIPLYLYVFHKYLHQFLPPSVAALAQALKLSGQYVMVEKSYTPPRIVNTNPIALYPHQVAQIEELITIAAHRMVEIHERNTLYPPEGSMYKECNKCHYNSLCVVKDPDRQQEILNAYPRRQYDPTNFR